MLTRVFQAEASEPATDGPLKFHFTAKGHKHTFKAASTAERDNWVAQLKTKIAEAKELAGTVTESETYKKTLEGLKPAPAKKEDKPAAAEPAAEEAAATEESAATTEAATAEPAKEEAKKEEEKTEKEEPKRRSASRKRASIFGNLLGKKEEKKLVEAADAKPAEGETPAESGAATEAPAAETTDAAPAAAEGAEEAKAEDKAEDKAENKNEEEKKEEKKEDKKEEAAEAKPTHNKRTR